MKLLKSIAPYVRMAFIVSIAAGMWGLAYSINGLKKEMHQIYILHIHQAEQINILLNLQIRESREKEQEWLRETRDQYKRLNDQDDNEKILEKSPE